MAPKHLSLLPLLVAACSPDPVAVRWDSGVAPRDAVPVVDAFVVEDRPAMDVGAPEDVVVAAPDVPAPEDLPPPEDVAAEKDVATFDDVSLPIEDVGSAGPIQDYSRNGPFLVGVWTGPITGTQGNARVFYPSIPVGNRFPLVVFAHGFQLNVGNYDGFLRHVASWGYVVASVDYPNSLLNTDHRAVPVAMRAARTVFAASRVTGFPEPGSVDASRAVAMGHSLGGKGAVWTALDDPGFIAAVALDPVDDNPIGGPDVMHPSLAPERMGGLAVPLALFGATQSRCAPLGQACAPEASNWATFAAAAPRTVPVATYPLQGFGHMDFVDTSCGLPCLTCARGAAPLTSRQLALRGLAVGFLERYAKGVMSAQAYVDGAVRDALRANNVLWNGRSDTLPPCR